MFHIIFSYNYLADGFQDTQVYPLQTVGQPTNPLSIVDRVNWTGRLLTQNPVVGVSIIVSMRKKRQF
jgi:hypothetical protein